jgi:Mce-associated membrane protein
MSAKAVSELCSDEDAVDEVDDIDEGGPSSQPAADDANSEPAARSRRLVSALRWATSFSLTAIVALSVLVGWLGFGAHQSQRAQAQRSQFLEAARQGALNLTTIDWRHADADVKRILDGATGKFHDDFARRSQPFVEVVKQAKATTLGTITEAGLESETADSAQALVAVSVQSSNAGETEQVPRAWRMRISVQKVGDQVKVSDVGFVP